MTLRSALFCTFIFLASARGAAANWGHWRGDGGNGVSLTAQPPTRWSATENVKWKARVPGRGSGSPVIWRDQVFVTTAVDAAAATRPGGALPPLRFQLRSYDRDTGQLRWERTAIEATPHESSHRTNGFASASPCTDGEHVYAHFGSRGLHCYTLLGDLVWQRDFGPMRTRNQFGEGSSPTLSGEMIIVPWDHEGPSFLYALNKRTGETIWQVPRDEPTCWATPLVIEHRGRRQIIMNGQNYARAYDLETGQELWRCDGQTERPVASAVAANGLVFVGSGFRGSFLAAFRPGGRGDIEGTDNLAWTIERDTPDVPSPVLSAGRLYFFKGRSGLLSCLDAGTGEPHYTTRRVGLRDIYASPIAAGGYVYLTDRNGTTVVIEDSPELRTVSTNSVGETVDASPSPIDRELFLRGASHLFCLAEEQR